MLVFDKLNLCAACIVALLFLCMLVDARAGNAFLIKDGIVDLSDYSFVDEEIAEISGYADFYHNRFLSTNEIEHTNCQPVKLLIERSWDHSVQGANRRLVDGYGTYHFKVIIPKQYVGEVFVLKTKYYNAYASVIEVNGVAVCHNGVLGTSGDDVAYKPGRRLEFKPFVVKNNVLDVVVKVANFTRFRGGIWSKIEFGPANDMIQKLERQVVFDAIAVSGLFIMFVYHFVLSFMIGQFDSDRRVDINGVRLTGKVKNFMRQLTAFDRVAFYFSLLCLIYALDYSLQNSMFFFVLLPNIDFYTILPFQQALNYMIAPVFGAFFYAMFPHEVSKRVIKLLVVMTSVILVMLFLTWGDIQKYIFKYHQFYLLLCAIYALYAIFKAIVNKRLGAVLFAFSLGVLISFSIVDLLAVFGLIKMVVLHAYGFLFFTFVISFIQGRRITHLLRNNIRLSRSLKKLNADLEGLVDIRTQELNRSLLRLKRLSDFKADMSHMLVHDLKSSLQTVVHANTLVHQPKGVKSIQQAGYNMLNLVQNVLDVYKYENARMDLALSPIDVSSMVKEAVEEIRFIAQQKSLWVDMSLCLPYTVMADDAVLRRVIVNLLANAVQYSPVNGQISIKTSGNDHQLLELSILNQGPEVPKEKQQLIFERFGQGEKRSARVLGSTGLGLAFCKMAIEAHNGKMGVESEQGQDVRFYFTVPLAGEPILAGGEDNVSFNTALSLSESDKCYLQGFVWQINQHRVYEVSALRHIIKTIDTERTHAIGHWAEQMEVAIYNCDEELFSSLINRIQEVLHDK